MKPELQDKLRTDHPKLLGNIGIDCGDGWFDLIDATCAAIEQDTTCQILPKIVQIKEKFAFCRIYTDGTGDGQYYEIISAAELESSNICEGCGKPGETTRVRNWLQVNCDSCSKKREEKYKVVV